MRLSPALKTCMTYGLQKKVPNALHHCTDLIIRFVFSIGVLGSGAVYSGDGTAAGNMHGKLGVFWLMGQEFFWTMLCMFYNFDVILF